MYVIAAAGNNGAPITDVTPASIPDVLTIGAFGQDLTPSTFSNYTGGSDISYTADDVNYGALDAWAPGEMIWAANKNGGYGYIAGTSAATAIASASFAYNMNCRLYSDGLVNETAKLPPNVLTIDTALREGILDLSDPKYSDSVNSIVTYNYRNDNIEGVKRISLQVTAGTTRTYRLADARQIKTISSSGLPDYITLVDNIGYFTINYSDTLEVPLINLDPIEFTIVNRSDDTVAIMIIRLVVLQSGYDDVETLLDEYPNYFEDNPELEYHLLDDACCNFTTFCQDIDGSCAKSSGNCIGNKSANCQCSVSCIPQ